MHTVLPDSAFTNELGHLVIGGCDIVPVCNRFGTPLLIFDRHTFENRATAFAAPVTPERVFYAGKAFLCVAVCELLNGLGFSLDVCTGGELATALAADFPAERILFHGNNKSTDELEQARDAGVGRIVVDSFEEIDRLAEVGIETRLLVRVTPGVEAHTHEFVQTGQEDSKFGFGLGDDIALEAVRRTAKLQGCELIGVHAHIGSQVFELAAFELAIQRLAEFAHQVKAETDISLRELNLGGGLGVAHTRDELTPDPNESTEQIVALVENEFRSKELEIPDVCVEPGRAMVDAAGVTLYEIGTVKMIPGVRTYVSVDGGMSDNIRPPLYGARYEGFLANRMDDAVGGRVSVAGKHCESGDVLIKDVHLPDDVASGDLLCIPATGAYTYSMASNYNRVPRPAVVMVHEGEPTEIVRRETYDDLLRLDRGLGARPSG